MIRDDLARRAVSAWQKCGLDWMPRMGAVYVADGRRWTVLDGPSLRVFDPEQRVAVLEPHVLIVGKGETYPPGWNPTRFFLPDLEDHATLGTRQ